jgi:hypothetical protein
MDLRCLFHRALIGLFLALCVASGSGCIGLGAQLIYWAKGGHKIEPEFAGLEDKRVAVLCVSNASSYGPNSACAMLQRSVAAILRQKGDKIDVIHEDEVADWIDTNGWNEMDYRVIGRGVDADAVLAIDLEDFGLHEGRTLYKGRASLTVSVYDMENGGQVVFRRSIPDFTFPRNSARHTTEMSEARFRGLFVTVLSQHVARYFCAYNLEEEFATDAMMLGE